MTYYTQQNGDLKRSRLGNLRAEKRIKPIARNLTPYEDTTKPPADRDKQKINLNFAWDTPFFASAHPGETVLYCAAQFVMRSEDRGASWQAISPDFGQGGLLALAESPLDAQRMVAAGGRGQVHLTSDGGKTWKPAGVGLPKKIIRDVVPSAHDQDRVYVVLSGKPDDDCASYVFVSNDFGETWKSIANNLPNESVNALAEDPKSRDLLFVGTDLGVYVSTDAGKSWESLCGTLPTAPVVDVAVHGRDGALVAATHGLSLFLLDIKPIRGDAGKP
jgi:photosystem II stability/assembly factor-like uncharacterized protein